MTGRTSFPGSSSQSAPFGRADTALFTRVFARAHRYWRRWDEGLWRYLELSAVAKLFRERRSLLGGPILDLGCGDGEVFEWLFGRRSDAFGIDSGATRMDDLVVARERGTYAEVRQDDAAHVSFPDQSFQLVFSNSVLEHVIPVGPVFEEVYRVLRPGGHFVFTTPDPELYSATCYYWRDALSRVGLHALGSALVTRECKAYHHVSILPFAHWKREAERAGFTHVERRGYMPAPVARVISRFGALTRVAGLRRFAWLLSREGRALSCPSTAGAERWIDRCWATLEPFARDSPGECGQLILARKASASASALEGE